MANNIQAKEKELKLLREKKMSGIMARAKARWQTEGENAQIIFVIWKNVTIMKK